MDMLLKSSIFNAPTCNSGVKSLYLVPSNRQMRMPMKILQRNNQYPFRLALNCVGRCNYRNYINSRHREKETDLFVGRAGLEFVGKDSESLSDENAVSGVNLEFVRELIKRGIVLAAMVFGCKRVFAMEGAADAGYGVIGQSILLLRNAWVLQVFKEQSLILAVLLGLSAFFWKGHKKKTAVIVVASIEVVSGMLIVGITIAEAGHLQEGVLVDGQEIAVNIFQRALDKD